MSDVSRIPTNVFQLDETAYVGREGQLFYGISDGKLRLSDGVTPGGILVYPGGGGTPFSTPPVTIPAPNGASTYTLPLTPVNPTCSFYFVNGIKRIYGSYYSISSNTLTILASGKPQTGDTHEIYVT